MRNNLYKRMYTKKNSMFIGSFKYLSNFQIVYKVGGAILKLN